MDATAQDVVLSHDLLNVEGILETLQPVSRRTGFDQRLRNSLARVGLKRRDQFVQKQWNVVVEDGNFEMPSGRKLPDLLAPAREQNIPVLPDELCQFPEIFDVHLNRAC